MQGIGRSVGLDLVDGLLVLEREVLGEHAGFLLGEDEIQVGGGAQGAMRIVVGARRHGKAAVEVFPEFFGSVKSIV